MGIFDTLKKALGGKDDRASDTETVAPSNWTPDPEYATTSEQTFVRETLSPPAPCGFSFDDVEIERRRKIRKATGEIIEESEAVIVEGANLRKVTDDVSAMVDVVYDFFGDAVPYQLGQISDQLAGYSKPCAINGCRLYAHLEIMPLTPTGKIKKYPIRVRVQYYHEIASLICKLEYLENGILGKARLDFWINRKGHEYKLSLKNGAYVVDAASVSENDTWTKTYPAP